MSAYAVVFAFVIVGVGFAAVTLIAAKVLRPSVPYARKESTYECGIPATGSTEVKLNIRFHTFALLFVLFDVEVLYVFPWAVTAREMGRVALTEMGAFLFVLALGLGYAWRKGALSWDK
jgi:NADH-quinone oxidoreductase subunit A